MESEILGSVDMAVFQTFNLQGSGIALLQGLGPAHVCWVDLSCNSLKIELPKGVVDRQKPAPVGTVNTLRFINWFAGFYISTQRYGILSGQFITTNPPRSPQMVVW